MFLLFPGELLSHTLSEIVAMKNVDEVDGLGDI